jgi:two-component system, sensor histidine kinase and response regulator
MNPEQPNNAAGQPASILVVDDTPANLQVLAGMLKDRGYKVRPVPGGKLALLAAQRDPPDLILLDINMPEMNGFEVCDHLKADARLHGIPVIFISALTEQMDKVKAFAVGGVDYLTKPFQMEELYARIETHLNLRRLQIELEETNAQLDASNKELESFSYSVSHDLRAPLRAIDGFSRILLEDHALHLSDEGKHYLNLVRDNTRQMGQLVDDLLAFSRLGRESLAKQTVDPSKLVSLCLAEMQKEQEGRHVKIVIGDLPFCRADPNLLKQVWTNLISNALKYTRKQEVVRIEIGCRTEPRVSGHGTETVFFVKDNGAGFDMKYAHKLFGVFQRLHRAADYDGTGVGLAIVQRIITRHGGRVWGEARLNQGATFSFTLD